MLISSHHTLVFASANLLIFETYQDNNFYSHNTSIFGIVYLSEPSIIIIGRSLEVGAGAAVPAWDISKSWRKRQFATK